MAVELVMPRLSDSMEEGTVVSWLVPDGTPVSQGQEIAEIETDKATLPYEAPERGVLRILVPEGTTLPLGQPIGLIDDLAFLPGGQSLAPPGMGAGAGVVPGPRPPADEPPTASFEIQPAMHQPPHTAHASSPPPEPEPTVTWSPAWGPQPTEHVAAAGEHEEEGETTEFAALDLRGLDPDLARAEDAATEPDAALAQQVALARQQAVNAHAAAQQAAARPIASQPVAVAQPLAPPADPVQAAAMPFAAPPAAAPAIPVVQAAPAAPHAAAPVAPPTAPVTTAPAAEPDDARRYAADELMAPATTPPRPPELRAAPGAGQARVSASPVARRLAGELGIDLASLDGSGPEGRIVRADIEAAQATGAARPPLPPAAAPTTASEFTPPVDDARAAAAILPAEPGEEPLAEEIDPTPAEETPAQPTEATQDAIDGAPLQPELTGLEQPTAAFEAVVSAPGAAPHEALHAVEPSPLPEPAEQLAEEIDPTPAEETPPAAPPVIDEQTAPEPEPEPEPTPAEPAPEPLQPVSEQRILPAAQPGGGKGEPIITELTRQQQTVARRMAESKATIPDFHTTVEVDAAPLLALQAELRTNRPDLAAPSVNDLLVKAVAIGLRAFPKLNGGYRDGRLEQYPRVNIGIATDTGGVLLVPVIHDADHLSVSQIAARTDEVLEKAKSGALRPPDIASATFTISNLGMYGIDEFTAVITPGQAGILTAGAIAERPVVRGGMIVAGKTLRLTLTTDHRAVYGLEAAEFLGRVRQLIEHPTSLLA